MNIVDRILFLIDKNNINAKKLTCDLELSSSAITDWKKGKGRPSIDAIIKISKYFNVTSDWLLTGEDEILSLPTDQQELLDLYSQLDPIKQAEFKGELKGYLKAKNGSS